MFFVYVIESQSSSKIYIGQTSDLDRRLMRHNGLLKNKLTSYTSKNDGYWKVIYTEKFETRNEAIKREKFLKSHAGRDYIRKSLAR